MANPVNPSSDCSHSITPAITCRNAAAAIEFYKKVFDAQELHRMASPDGKIAHAEIRIGDSKIMLSDEFPGMSAPPAANSLPSSQLYLYVADVDSTFKRAIDAGAQSVMPVQDMFWGDRYGTLTDPFGHRWGIATHKEDVAPDEMQRRAAAFMSKAATAKP